MFKFFKKLFKRNKSTDETVSICADIASKTIGFDLVSTTPMTPEETSELHKKQEEARKKWEAEHPEEVAAAKKWMEKLSSKKPYILSPWERELIKEIANIDDEKLDFYETYIYDDGEICLRSPKEYWLALAGREWAINLQDKTYHCVAMN